MCGSTLPFALMKTYGPISVDLREKRKTHFFLYLSLSSLLTPPPPVSSFLLFDFAFFFFFNMMQCPYLIRVRFYSETIYFFLVQFSLNELSSSNFLTSEIFIKILSLKLLATYHPENPKKNSDYLRIQRKFSRSLDFTRRI